MVFKMTMTSITKIVSEELSGRAEYSLDCLRQASLFRHLSEMEIACFNEAAKGRAYKKGQMLYLQDEPEKFFYVVCGGWIKLYHTTQEGEEVVVDMLTTGDMAGESAIFADGRHTSSAQIIEDAYLLSIPAQVLKEQISLSPTLALSMLSSMSKHHRRHYGEIAVNAMQSAPQRVGRFLLRLCPKDKRTDVVLQLPYDKTLIAHILGMKGATFSRALNELRLKTNIRIKGPHVEIDSVVKLAQFVYGPLATKFMPEEF